MKLVRYWLWHCRLLPRRPEGRAEECCTAGPQRAAQKQTGCVGRVASLHKGTDDKATTKKREEGKGRGTAWLATVGESQARVKEHRKERGVLIVDRKAEAKKRPEKCGENAEKARDEPMRRS